MKPTHRAATLLVIVYLFLVVVGIGRLFFGSTNVFGLAGLALDSIVLLALLAVGGATGRSIAIKASWIRIALGILLILLGLWDILTLDLLSGLFAIAIGILMGLMLGHWTIRVLVHMNVEATR